MENGFEAPSAPRILGRYAIYDAIASGGMATVHYGRLLGPVGFSRTVAIKRLHPQFAQDPQFVTMFLDEARLAGRIRHPNVVATLDVVASNSEIFLVMDYVHGEALSRIIRELNERNELVPLPIALRIATDTLQGLHAAHEARDERGTPLNIVHRDVSPQNILLGVDGISRLVDFGVAKASGQGATTREGHIKGKLGYMSPEQLRGQKLTRQSDVHAAAIVLWELLTSRRLFLGATEADTIARVVKHEITPASDYVKGLNPQVDAVLRRGLSESLEDRYATAREMCIALEACGDIASTMQVADWVQAQVHELLEVRTRVVSAIESSQHDAVPAGEPSSPSAAGSSGAKSTKEWVQRLSSPDLQEAETVSGAEVPALAASPLASTADAVASSSVSAMIEAIPGGRKPLNWYTVAGVAAGVVGLVLVALSFGGRSPSAQDAPLAAQQAPRAGAAVVPGPSIPAVPSDAPLGSAAPVVSAAPAAPPAPSAPQVVAAPPPRPPAPPPPAARTPPTSTPPAGAAPKAKPTKPKGDIFDTRE